MINSSPLVFHHAYHSYDSKRVLNDISISFENEKITAVLGKSGSGKTTLLQLLNGMIKPDEGSVHAFGKPIDHTQLHALRLKMGYVVQQGGLFPHLNIFSNISLLGKITRQSNDNMDSRAKQLMGLVQMPVGYLSKYPNELSGGEQQRVGLCRALFLNPPVLLMDEPFASLDYETKQGIYTHLLSIQKIEPRTIVLVTHDWDEATRLANCFVWIKNGAVEKSGDVHELEKLKVNFTANV